ncbi:MAG: alpha-L-fucosidase [Christensenellaceae bacterium]|nr:alpha-L-fucosidase [Christensenellaceae bacterium]
MDTERYIKKIDEVIDRGPYSADWASLSKYRTPEWFMDLKLGIFIHWGVYSVPAYGNEWYPHNMYVKGSDEYEHHIKTYGPHKTFGYKDFIPMFRGEDFDPEDWAQLFCDAGARYVVPVAEHHDGFQMYKSDISHWNAYEMGPKRDVLGELTAQCRKKGLETGCSSHRIEHWFYMGNGRDFDSDVCEPMQKGDLYWPAMTEADHHDIFSKPAPTKEFLDDWMIRTCELIDNYRPQILYFDWWIHHSSAKEHLKKIAAYYYNRAHEWGRDVVINYKHDAFLFGTAVPDVERGQFADLKHYYWQGCGAVALNSWGYTENNRYRTPYEIICDFIDIISKNGNMLLNVGPRSDGTIPDEDREILLAIGRWLKVNGEAVYGARTWRIFGEGPTRITEGQFADDIKKNFTSSDFRFMTSKDCLYVFALRPDEKGEYSVTALGDRDAKKKANFKGIIKDISVLGSDEKPVWTRDEEALHIRTSFKSDLPIVFRLKID